MVYRSKLPGKAASVFLIAAAATGFMSRSLAQVVPSRGYYISPSGHDHNNGDKRHPWRSLDKTHGLRLHPGDAIYLEGGHIYHGSVSLDSMTNGNEYTLVTIGSYGNGKAVIDAGNTTAISIRGCNHMLIRGLILKGNGRRQGNTGRGIRLVNAGDIRIDGIEVSGFQKSGVEINNCSRVRMENIFAHDNGYAGIAVQGDYFPQRSNHHIYIGHCRAENNPGDPTELGNHSGNGIVAGLSTDVLIEYCSATNNGWDMPRKGNGPVGIWAWESDSVTIQHCLSYRNRTSPGSMDGGGFDLDGGVTHSMVQYNLSYENEGYGYGIFQFAGASPWHDNIFRYNISFNDGNTTQQAASVLWWNGSNDSSQFHDCYFYHNLLYNARGYALGVIPGQYANRRFFFLNNIFVAKNELMTGGNIRNESFYGNDWWSLQRGFRLNDFSSLRTWAETTGKEMLEGRPTGTNADPRIVHPVSPGISSAGKLSTIAGFKLSGDSPLRDRGLDLKKLFGLDSGGKDFYGRPVPQGKACEPGPAEME